MKDPIFHVLEYVSGRNKVGEVVFVRNIVKAFSVSSKRALHGRCSCNSALFQGPMFRGSVYNGYGYPLRAPMAVNSVDPFEHPHKVISDSLARSNVSLLVRPLINPIQTKYTHRKTNLDVWAIREKLHNANQDVVVAFISV